MRVTMNVDQRREAMGDGRCTLNGEPAMVGGVLNQFATVTSLKSHLSAEWCWETVARIMANGKAFKS